MKPTRRAVALVVVCGVAVWLAARFGARSLNAVVVPAVVALVAAVVQLLRTDRPTVTRTPPAPGFPGETRTVEIEVATDDPTTARITDTVGDGLRAPNPSAKRGIPTTVAYELEYDSRGERRLGPLTLTVTDVFGLVTETFSYPKRTPVLVYPTVYDLADAPGTLGTNEERDERETFDELREYVRGDSLRDIHWKASAKHDDLVVMEFDTQAGPSGLTIAAEATAGHADAMASAAASIALALLDADFAISLSTPGTTIDHAEGDTQRDRVLAALARAGAGRVDSTDADVHVLADADGTHVAIEDRSLPFERLAGPVAVAADGGRES